MPKKKFTIEDLDAIVDKALTPKPKKGALPSFPPKVKSPALPKLPRVTKLPKVRQRGLNKVTMPGLVKVRSAKTNALLTEFQTYISRNGAI